MRIVAEILRFFPFVGLIMPPSYIIQMFHSTSRKDSRRMLSHTKRESKKCVEASWGLHAADDNGLVMVQEPIMVCY